MHVLVAMYMHACIFSDFFCRFSLINAKGGALGVESLKNVLTSLWRNLRNNITV